MHQFMQKKQKSEPTDYAAKFEDRGGGDATYVAKGQIGEFRFLKELRKSDCELS